MLSSFLKTFLSKVGDENKIVVATLRGSRESQECVSVSTYTKTEILKLNPEIFKRSCRLVEIGAAMPGVFFFTVRDFSKNTKETFNPTKYNNNSHLSIDKQTLSFVDNNLFDTGRYSVYLDSTSKVVTLAPDELGPVRISATGVGLKGREASSKQLCKLIQKYVLGPDEIYFNTTTKYTALGKCLCIHPVGSHIENFNLDNSVLQKYLTTKVHDRAKLYDNRMFFPKMFDVTPGIYKYEFNIKYGAKLTPDITGSVRIRRAKGRDGSLAGCTACGTTFIGDVKTWFGAKKDQLFLVEVKGGIVYFNV